MSRRSLIVIVVAIIAIVAAIVFLVIGQGGGPGASPSTTLPPVPASDVVATDVRAVPIHHAELGAPAGGGRVAEVLVAEGDTVTAGQALLRLESAHATAQMAQATAGVAAAEAAARQAQAADGQAAALVNVAVAGVDQAEAAVRTADATRDAGPSGGAAGRAADAEVARARAAAHAARFQLTAARRGADVAKAAADAAAADADRAKAVLTDAQAALDDLTLEAPMAGIVASLDAIVGETITPGAPVVRIADTSAWRFESTDLDETSIGRLVDGADATVTVDAFPDVAIPARVVSISQFGETSAGDIVYTVTLEPTGDLPDGLRWNMTAGADIKAQP